jgi:hypothetical protein
MAVILFIQEETRHLIRKAPSSSIVLRQKYGITEGNPAFKYNTRKILMILDEDMNDMQTE